MQQRSQPSEVADILKVMHLVQVPMFIVGISGDGQFRCLGTNEAYVGLTGLPCAKCDGCPIQELFPTRAAGAIAANYRRCIDQRAPLEYDEVLLLASGTRNCRTSLTPLFESGDVVALVGATVDLTAEKQEEFRLRSLIEAFAKTNDDLKNIITTLAHDLRAPIRRIGALVELVKDGFPDLGNGKLRDLQLVEANVGKLNALIEKRINIAFLSSRLKVTAKETSLSVWLNEVAALLDPHQRIGITCEDATVRCEEILLDICLRNVADNAVRFARSTVMIAVRAHPNGLEITVEDDGCGFSAGTVEKRTRITQANVHVLSKGVGLRSTIDILSIRGGELWVEPVETGSGARVTLVFPGILLDQRDRPEHQHAI